MMCGPGRPKPRQTWIWKCLSFLKAAIWDTRIPISLMIDLPLIHRCLKVLGICWESWWGKSWEIPFSHDSSMAGAGNPGHKSRMRGLCHVQLVELSPCPLPSQLQGGAPVWNRLVGTTNSNIYIYLHTCILAVFLAVYNYMRAFMYA